MKTSRKGPIIAAVVGAIGLAAGTNAANAGAVASAYQGQLNLVFLNSGGTPLVNPTDFAGLVGTNSGDASATLGGTTNADGDSGPIFDSIDIARQCVGLCPQQPENTFLVGPGSNMSTNTIGSPPAGNYAEADQFEAGSPIDDLGNAIGPGFGTSSTAQVVANVALVSSSNSGSATANNGLTSTFVFTVAGSTAVTIEFDGEHYLEASTDVGESFPSFASATSGLSVIIRDQNAGNATVFSWAPDGVAGGITGGVENNDPFTMNVLGGVGRDAPFNGSTFVGESLGVACTTGSTSTACGADGIGGTAGAHSATTGVLLPGVTYQLTLSQFVSVNAARLVPEPGTLSLLGASFVGLSLLRRRRTKVKATTA